MAVVVPSSELENCGETPPSTGRAESGNNSGHCRGVSTAASRGFATHFYRAA